MGAFRLIFALTIFLGHIYAIFGFDPNSFEFTGSAVAFQSFFIVSGFFTALILNEKYVGARYSYRVFITNRLLRIYPLYWFLVLLTIGVCLCFYFTQGDALILQPLITYFGDFDLTAKLYAVLSNLFLIGQELVFFLDYDLSTGQLYFDGDFLGAEPQVHRFLLISQAWAISYILLFYLIAPFIVRRKWQVIFILMALSLGARFYTYAQGYHVEPWKYRFFPFELAMFLAGTLSYKLYAQIASWKFNEWGLRVVVLAFLGFTCVYKFVPGDYNAKHWIYYTLLALMMPLIFKLTQKWKWDRFIGELAYPLYLVHFLVIHFWGVVLGKEHPFIVSIIILTAFVVSFLLLFLIIQPIDRYRQRRIV